MTISVAIRIEGQAAGLPYEATTSESVTATLDSVAGVNSVAWSVAGGDDLVAAASYTLTPSGVKGETVTFSMSATAGTALILQAVVNADPTLYARAKVWIPANNGLEVGADGEGYEGDATHGTARIQNEAIRASGVGTDVPQTRLITTTAPLRIDGSGSADLSADRTLTITAATGAATGTVTLGGDLAGTGSTAAAPRTSGINSTTVGAGGALATGTVLRATGVSAAAWGALDLANASAVTGVLPKGNQGVQDMLGDVTGSTAVSVVAKVNGTTVNAGGALAVGQVLRATGAAAAEWGALNLADTDAVTGALPAVNQADQTMAGDVSGSTGSSTVDAIRGTSVSSAGGALVTGAVLRVTGVSSCDWGAVNLADTDAVTGVLPVGNVDATATPTASKIAMWNASVYMGATRFYGAGTVATAGLLAAANNVVVASARNAANGANIALLTTDGADKLTVGDAANASAVDVSALTTLRTMIGAAVSTHATEKGLSIGMAPSFGGGVGVVGLVNAGTPPSTAPTGGVVAYADAGALKVWSPKKLRSSLAPETNNAATDQRLDGIHQSVTTADATPTVIATYALPTACCFVARIFVTGQQTGTDTTAVYAFDVTAKRAAGACVVTAPTVTTLIDSIGVAAVPSVTNATNDVQFSVTGKLATSIDWAISSVHVHLFSV